MAFLNRALFCAGVMWIVAAFPAAAENIELAEQKIKAGLLYNFLKYTDWPDTSLAQDAPLTVCVLGRDSFEGSLDPLEGRNVKQRNIAIRKMTEGSDVVGCHLLFLDSGVKKRWPELRARLADKSVLTVSDLPGFIHDGGMIEFGSKQNRIDVTLNLQAVKSAHLAVQERLLRLVTVVEP